MLTLSLCNTLLYTPALLLLFFLQLTMFALVSFIAAGCQFSDNIF